MSDVSVVHFGFEARIEGWQNINTFVYGDMVLFVGFSSSVGSSQLWNDGRHGLINGFPTPGIEPRPSGWKLGTLWILLPIIKNIYAASSSSPNADRMGVDPVSSP